MRPTEKLAGWSLVLGALIGCLVIPSFGFWGWLIVTLIVTGFLYNAWITRIAKERIVDRDHDPDRPQR